MTVSRAVQACESVTVYVYVPATSPEVAEPENVYGVVPPVAERVTLPRPAKQDIWVAVAFKISSAGAALMVADVVEVHPLESVTVYV